MEAIELGADVMIDQELKENEPYTDVETAELDEEVQMSNHAKNSDSSKDQKEPVQKSEAIQSE